METDKIKTQFEQANQHLVAAKNELNRPAEDVVPYMVCESARYAISHYMQGFLLRHGIAFDEGITVEALLEKCRSIDDNFNSFDLSAITFAGDDEYSAEFDQMENSMDLAEEAKKLVGA